MLRFGIIGVEECVEYTLLHAAIVAFELVKCLFCVLTASDTVGRAILRHRNDAAGANKMADFLFGSEKKRTNDSHITAVEIGHGTEAIEAPLDKEVHNYRFDGVVKMMSECKLVAV